MRATALVMALVLGGCAALSVRGPRDHGEPHCTTGKGAVGVDGTMGALTGIIAIAIASASGGAALVFGAISAAYIGSAWHGSKVVNRCRAATRDYEQADERLAIEAKQLDAVDAAPAV